MKAILVIEKPIDCQHCRLVQRDYGNDYWCPLKGELEFDEMTKIHEDCPLKEMPKKAKIFQKETNERIIAKGREYGDVVNIGAYVDGWNDCLEELEK